MNALSLTQQSDQSAHAAKVKFERKVQREIRRETGKQLTLQQTRQLIGTHQQEAIRRQNETRQSVMDALREFEPAFMRDGCGIRGPQNTGQTSESTPRIERNDFPFPKTQPPKGVEEDFIGHVCVDVEGTPTDYLARIHGSLIEPA